MRTPPPARRLAGTSPRRLPPGDGEPVTGLRREPRARRGRPVKRGGAFTWARGGDWWSGDWKATWGAGKYLSSPAPRSMPAGPSGEEAARWSGGHAPRAFTCHLAPPARHAATVLGPAPVVRDPLCDVRTLNSRSFHLEKNSELWAKVRDLSGSDSAQHSGIGDGDGATDPAAATVRHGTSQVAERTKGQRGAVARPTRSPGSCLHGGAPVAHARRLRSMPA